MVLKIANLGLVAIACEAYPIKRRLPLSMVVAPTIDKYINPCAATFFEDELELMAPFLPINRHQEREQNVRDCEKCRETKRESEGLQWQQPCCHCSSCKGQQMRVGSRVE